MKMYYVIQLAVSKNNYMIPNSYFYLYPELVKSAASTLNHVDFSEKNYTKLKVIFLIKGK